MNGVESSRREALRRGMAVGGAALAAAAAPSLLRAGSAFAQEADTSEGDAGIIAGTVEFEQAAVLVYGVGIERRLLGPATDAGELLRGQDREHADTLTALLEKIGGNVPAPPRTEDIPGLSELKTETEFLEFAVGLEKQAVAAYADALQNLRETGPMRILTRIMSSDAQHLVILRQALGVNPVPTAFPTGMEKG